MNGHGELSASQWLDQLETDCHSVLRSADRLLARSAALRRRRGTSRTGRLLHPLLLQLQSWEAFLEPPEQQRLQSLQASLLERWEHLNRCRFLPCPELRKLRSQCRTFELPSPIDDQHWNFPSVLVGSLRRPSQLDVCLNHNFYHVPAYRIPDERLPISYVAIYQSRSLFPEDCGISFYGKVKACKLVRRWQISEIPKDSDELYYRLEVECWEQLEHPIAVREIPLTHLFTNLFLLSHSQETPELSLSTPEQYRWYQTLRNSLDLGNGTVLRHPGGTIRLKNGRFGVYRRRRKVAAFWAEDFVRTPAAVFGQLTDALNIAQETI